MTFNKQSFTVEERTKANLVAPRGNIITTTGDQSAITGEPVAHDLSPTIQLNVTPPLAFAAAAPKGVRFVAAGLRKLAEWRAFFTLKSSVLLLTQPKLLTHSDHGNVSILHSTPWQSNIFLHRTCYHSHDHMCYLHWQTPPISLYPLPSTNRRPAPTNL